MNSPNKYKALFIEIFGLAENEIGPNTKYQAVHGWDSVGHMALMAAIEDAFVIELDIDDIIDFSSYDVGINILRKYNVDVLE